MPQRPRFEKLANDAKTRIKEISGASQSIQRRPHRKPKPVKAPPPAKK
jgi:hypothetical protein